MHSCASIYEQGISLIVWEGHAESTAIMALLDLHHDGATLGDARSLL